MTGRAFYCSYRGYDEQEDAIVFAGSKKKARELHAKRIDCPPEEVTVIRKKIFDVYAKTGRVPAKARLHDGWWFECHNCECRISFDADDEIAYDLDHIKEDARERAEARVELEDIDRKLSLPPVNDPSSPEYKWEMLAREPKAVEHRRRSLLDIAEARPLLNTDAYVFEGNDIVYCTIACQSAHYERVAYHDVKAETLVERAQERWPDAVEVKCKGWPYLEQQVEIKLPGFSNFAGWDHDTDEVRITAGDVAAWEAYQSVANSTVCEPCAGTGWSEDGLGCPPCNGGGIIYDSDASAS